MYAALRYPSDRTIYSFTAFDVIRNSCSTIARNAAVTVKDE